MRQTEAFKGEVGERSTWGARAAMALSVIFQIVYLGLAIWVGIQTWGTLWFWLWVVVGVPMLFGGLGKALALGVAVVVGSLVDRIEPRRATASDIRLYRDVSASSSANPAPSYSLPRPSPYGRLYAFPSDWSMGRLYMRAPSDGWKGLDDWWDGQGSDAEGDLVVPYGQQVRLWVSQSHKKESVVASLAPLRDYAPSSFNSLMVLGGTGEDLAHVAHLVGLDEIGFNGDVSDEALEYLVGMEQLKGFHPAAQGPSDPALARVVDTKPLLSFFHSTGYSVGPHTLEALGRRTHLRSLKMPRTHAAGRDFRALADLVLLEVFHGQEASLTNEDLRILLGAWGQIQDLDVERATVSSQAFGEGPVEGYALEHVNVSDTQVTGRVFRSSCFPHLRDLALAGTPTQDDDLAAISELPNLTSLSLYNCPVSSAGLRHLKGAAHLRHLGIHSDPEIRRGLLELLMTHEQLQSVAHGLRIYRGEAGLGQLRSELRGS